VLSSIPEVPINLKQRGTTMLYEVHCTTKQQTMVFGDFDEVICPICGNYYGDGHPNPYSGRDTCIFSVKKLIHNNDQPRQTGVTMP
jgi:hypothetical protein